MSIWLTIRNRIDNRARWLKMAAVTFIIKTVFRILYLCTREVEVFGLSQIDQLLESGKPFLPCYWHQQALFCAYYLFQQQSRGLKLGFLVSPSEDGDIGSNIIDSWGARSIRGSSSETGGQALRNLYHAIVQEGVSITTSPDGPRGPVFEFKAGVIMLARVSGAPILPMAYAADRAWRLKSWDQFFIPKPLSRIVIVIGEPVNIPSKLNQAETKEQQVEMAEILNRLSETAVLKLAAKTK